MTISQVDQTTNDILRTQWNGVPAVRVDSPPGAGKTGLVVRLIAQSFGLMGERVAAATQTNQQAQDLARRLCARYPTLPVILLHRTGQKPPSDLQQIANLSFEERPKDLPSGPCAVISTAAKWTYYPADGPMFDLLVIDEAYQLTESRFLPIANLARRLVMVGDPGQLPPIVSVEIERWSDNPMGPHIAAPHVLLARHPGITLHPLTHSRRLVHDTVQLVQPIFYPNLHFSALDPEGSRALILPGSGEDIDAPLEQAASGASIVGVPLPERHTGEQDHALASHIATLITRLLVRKAEIRDYFGQRPLTPSDIGVVCPHISQVSAIQELLPASASDVLVETADRFQGLERSVMFVWHPLSGRASCTDFALQPGRMCVMLSRHRIACFLVGRQGIEATLDNHAPSGNRELGVAEDAEHTGWLAHRRLMQALQSAGRWPVSG